MAHTVVRDGHSVQYRKIGATGPYVVLLHGLGLAGDFWFDVPERLAQLNGQPHQVLVLDNRGVGGSTLPSRPFSIGAMADDVVEVMNAEGVEAAVVVGISLGGMIAQHVALRHPTRVSGLVLLATTGGGLRTRLPRPSVVRTLLSVPFAARRKRGPNLDAFARLVLPERELPHMEIHFRDWGPLFARHPVRLRSFFAQLGAVLTHLKGADVGSIRCPTAVVTGDEDTLIPKRNAALLAAAIPGSSLEVLAGVGHGIPLLDPEAVNRNVARVQLKLGLCTSRAASAAKGLRRQAG